MVNWQTVSLSRHTVTKPGRAYRYWYLRWFGSNGIQHGECIGRVDGPKRLSHRQAEVLRRRKEQEINEHPGRRDIVRVPTLPQFLEIYCASRVSELAPGTMRLHKQTAKYLLAYFGPNCCIDQITRADARSFKTALANSDLKHVSKRPRDMKLATVDMHIRNARTMFNQAIEDDYILSNPFRKLSKPVKVKKDWCYVGLDELRRLLEACPNRGWRMLLALCRLAGLRQGEALSLTWHDVDWEKSWLTVWSEKTKRTRKVPIAPELLPLLRDAFESAKEGESLIVTGINRSNLWRDFQVICRRASVKTYKKWCQTLRKNREHDWNRVFASYIVSEWMGHSEEVARKHYLRVYEHDMAKATIASIPPDLAQNLAQKGENKTVDRKEENHIDLLQKEI